MFLFGRGAILTEPAPLRHGSTQPSTVGVRGGIAEHQQLIILAAVADAADGETGRGRAGGGW
jgi:hypothetical protein